ncbi:hypothetical protein [uncultured Roseobacter sp.]|nr:hypothetical protein [uncultured Roseobacter sp.]
MTGVGWIGSLIIGATLGGWIGQLIVAAAGAFMLIFVARLVRRKT